MIIGASTACMYPMLIEEALYELVSRGVKTVELFINCSDELDGKPMQEMCKLMEENNVKAQAFHPFTSPVEPIMLFSRYERRASEILDYYERFFSAMQSVDAKVFVLHGASRLGSCTDERYLERYLSLYRLGQKYGVAVAQENVHYCRSGDLEFLKLMVNELGDEVAFNLDIKQAIRSNLDPFAVLDVVGEKLVHVHISDNDQQHDCLPPGKGKFNFKAFIERLNQLSYQGALIVELYRQNYGKYDELVESIQYVENITSMVGALHKDFSK